MAKIRSKKRGDKRKVTEIFCYVCKCYITIGTTKREDAIQAFHEQGHHSGVLAETAPDMGREHRRHDRAVALRRVR